MDTDNDLLSESLASSILCGSPPYTFFTDKIPVRKARISTHTPLTKNISGRQERKKSRAEQKFKSSKNRIFLMIKKREILVASIVLHPLPLTVSAIKKRFQTVKMNKEW